MVAIQRPLSHCGWAIWQLSLSLWPFVCSSVVYVGGNAYISVFICVSVRVLYLLFSQIRG